MSVSFQYNKTSLNKLGRDLSMRERALPILKNKESALRVEVIKQKQEIKALQQEVNNLKQAEDKLMPLIGRFPIKQLQITDIATKKKKIAGVTIPILDSVEIKMTEILWHEAPHWYPDVILYLKERAEKVARLTIGEIELSILERERKKTTQKVNLYEKVQIPEIQTAIKKIKRFLEDEQNLSKAAQKIVKARKNAA